jgi:hypothetical protein
VESFEGCVCKTSCGESREIACPSGNRGLNQPNFCLRREGEEVVWRVFEEVLFDFTRFWSDVSTKSLVGMISVWMIVLAERSLV